MQRWSMGQSRSMQGRQNTWWTRMSLLPGLPIGDVTRSSVGPKIAVTGTPTAAARCMAPGIVRDEGPTLLEHARQQPQIRSANQIDDAPPDAVAPILSHARRRDLRRRRRARTSRPGRPDVRELRHPRRRPAFRVTVCGAGCQADDCARRIEPVFARADRGHAARWRL